MEQKTAKQVNDQQTGEAYLIAETTQDDEEPIVMSRACPVNCEGNIKPVWQDQPDSEGWWWFGNKDRVVDCYFITYGEMNKYGGRCKDDLEFRVWDLKGKWCKAIVPEREG